MAVRVVEVSSKTTQQTGILQSGHLRASPLQTEGERELHFATAVVSCVRELVMAPSRLAAERLAALVPEFEVVLGRPLTEFPTVDVLREGVTSSERIIGVRALELDRLLGALRCYIQLAEASRSEERYEHFTSSQNQASRLTVENFNRLSELVRTRIASPEQEAALFLGLIYNTAAKAPVESWQCLESPQCATGNIAVRQAFLVEEALRTDDHATMLARRLELLPESMPSLTKLSPSTRLTYEAALRAPNLGQLLQLEGMEALLRSYPDLPTEVKDLHLVQFLSQICGARSHECELGSLTMTEDLAQRWLALEKSLKQDNPELIYKSLLCERAVAYGVDPSTDEGRAIVRLGAMYGFQDMRDIRVLRDALFSSAFPKGERETLIRELAVSGLSGQPAILAYHAPALLKNCLQIEDSGGSGYLKGFGVGLRTLAYVYESTREDSCTQDTSITTVSVREVARQARLLPIQPVLAVSRPRDVMNGAFSLSESWVDYASSLRAHQELTATRLPSIAPETHLLLDQILTIATIVTERCAMEVTRRDLPARLRSKMERSIHKLFHMATVASVHVPTNLTRASLEDLSPETSLNSAAGALRRATRQLVSSVPPELSKLLPGDLAANVIREGRELERLTGAIDRCAVKYELSVSPVDNFLLFEHRRQDREPAQILFSLQRGSLLIGGHSDVDVSLGLVCSVHYEQHPELDAEQIEQSRALFRRFIGCETPLFPCFRITEKGTRSERIVAEELQRYRSRRSAVVAHLEELDTALAARTDTISLISRGASHREEGLLWRLVDSRGYIRSSANKYLHIGSLESFEALSSNILQTRQLLSEVTSIEDSYTSVVDHQTARLSDICGKLADLAAPLRYNRSDPRMYHQGGCALDLTEKSLIDLVDAGARIIICKVAPDVYSGFCVYLPGDALQRNAPHINRIFGGFGYSAFIWYLHVDAQASSAVPTFDLLINRLRLDACEYDVLGAQIALSNRRSLVINTSSIGRSQITPNYRGVSQRPTSLNGHKGPEFSSKTSVVARTQDFSIGIVAPIKPFWRHQFDRFFQGNSHAINISKHVLNRSLPGLFHRDVVDLIFLYKSICNRRAYLLSLGDLATKADKVELSRRIPEWLSAVDELLRVDPVTSKKLDELLLDGHEEHLINFSTRHFQHLDRDRILELLDYY